MVGAAEGQERVRAGDAPRLTQYWKAIFRACSTAAAPSDGEQEVGVVDRHHGRQRLGQLDHDAVAVAQQVEWATRPSWSAMAWSSSGTRWPRVLTHSDEMASR